MSRILTALLTISLLAASNLTYAQSSTQRIRGDVVVLDGANLRIKSPEGEDLTVKLMDDVRLTAVSRASPADIKYCSEAQTTGARHNSFPFNVRQLA